MICKTCGESIEFCVFCKIWHHRLPTTYLHKAIPRTDATSERLCRTLSVLNNREIVTGEDLEFIINIVPK